MAGAPPRTFDEQEEQAVRSALARLESDDYQVGVADDAVVVFEPDRPRAQLEEIIRFLGPFGSNPKTMDVLTRGMRYSPVLRFVLDDEQARIFHVERMTYRGEGGWSWPLDQGQLTDLVVEFLPHLGEDSFFDLV